MKHRILLSMRYPLLALAAMLACGHAGAQISASERWETRSTAPGPRQGHSAVWSGREMLIWGGGHGFFYNDGGRYNPANDSWQFITTSNAPSGRWFHVAVWAETAGGGGQMLIWGGRSAFYAYNNKNSGGRYDPLTDSWTPITTNGAPEPRSHVVYAWTGSELLIWGGAGDGNVSWKTGARYNPVSDTWLPMTTNGAPAGRIYAHTVWTGTEFLIWGGCTGDLAIRYSDGARYNPLTDQWRPISTNGAPPATYCGSAVWTGREMLVWGGASAQTSTGPILGGRYNPLTDSWLLMSISNAPTGRVWEGTVWTGQEMVIWGGSPIPGDVLNTGARYNPQRDEWNALTQVNAPPARSVFGTVWTGEAMLIFGGNDAGNGDHNENYAWFPPGPSLVFSADFESGNNGFTYPENPGGDINLWHRTAHRASSSTHAQYYGLEDLWHYNTGARHLGYLLSPTISLAGVAAPISLSFNYLLDTETHTNYDRVTLSLSTDGGNGWTTLATRVGSNSFSTGLSWTNWQTDLSSYAGSNILLRFGFDTVDSANNNFEGWYIDDVNIWGVQTKPRLCLRAPILRPNGRFDLQVDSCNNVALGSADAANTRIHWTTDLVNWQQLTNLPVLSSGSLWVNGLSLSNSPSRFYRAVAP